MLTTRYDKIEAEPFSFLLVFRSLLFNIILIIGNIIVNEWAANKVSWCIQNRINKSFKSKSIIIWCIQNRINKSFKSKSIIIFPKVSNFQGIVNTYRNLL